MHNLHMLARDVVWFLTLADTVNVTDAAAELGLPQSTLSRRLARLEADLGATLFERRGRSLRLNSRGATLARAYRTVYKELDLAQAEIRRLGDPETGLVRFEFMHSLGPWLAPRLLRRFTTRHPRAEIRLNQGTGAELVARLRSDDCDVALCSPRPDGADLGWLEVQRQPLAFLVPATHRFAGWHDVSMGDVVGEPVVTTPPGFTTRALLDEAAAEAGVEVSIAFESVELGTVAGLVRAGLGIAPLPADDPVLALPGTVFVPLRTHLTREVGLAWRADASLTPTARLFVDEIAALVAETAGSSR